MKPRAKSWRKDFENRATEKPLRSALSVHSKSFTIRSIPPKNMPMTPWCPSIASWR